MINFTVFNLKENTGKVQVNIKKGDSGDRMFHTFYSPSHPEFFCYAFTFVNGLISFMNSAN
jgi:hypothetical protein